MTPRAMGRRDFGALALGTLGWTSGHRAIGTSDHRDSGPSGDRRSRRLDFTLERKGSQWLDDVDAAPGTDVGGSRTGKGRERKINGADRVRTRSPQGYHRRPGRWRRTGDPDFGRGLRRAANDAQLPELSPEVPVQMGRKEMAAAQRACNGPRQRPALPRARGARGAGPDVGALGRAADPGT